MPSHYLFFVLLLVLAAVYLACRKRIRRVTTSSRRRVEPGSRMAAEARFARKTALAHRFAVLHQQFWSLSAKTDEQQVEYRLIKEQVRIAQWNLSYYQLLCDNPLHACATIPGEKEWALTSAELAITFAAARIERFRLLPTLSPCRPARRIGAVS